MIHICICDDSDAMRDELCGLIQGLCQKHSIAASVSCCSCLLYTYDAADD